MRSELVFLPGTVKASMASIWSLVPFMSLIDPATMSNRPLSDSLSPSFSSSLSPRVQIHQERKHQWIIQSLSSAGGYWFSLQASRLWLSLDQPVISGQLAVARGRMESWYSTAFWNKTYRYSIIHGLFKYEYLTLGNKSMLLSPLLANMVN